MYSTTDLPHRVLASETSPGFRHPPPVIVAEERIPPDIRTAMSWAWQADYSAPRRIEAIMLHDVYVGSEGLVFDRDFNVFGRSITQQPPEQIDRGRGEVMQAVAERRCRTIHKPLCLCVKPGMLNYGHWLVELLPKVDFASRHLPQNLAFLVPQANGRFGEVVSGSLARFGIEPGRCVGYDGQPLFARELVMVDGFSFHGGFMSPAVLDTLDRLSAGIRPGDAEKLFLRRKIPAHRRFVDEDAVARFFAERGYEAISPEDHTLAEQIALFKGARAVAGVVGAGFTNIGFSRPGARVDLFYPAGMPDTFYWFLAHHRGLPFRDIRCEQVGEPAMAPWDTDMRIDPRELAALMDGIVP